MIIILRENEGTERILRKRLHAVAEPLNASIIAIVNN